MPSFLVMDFESVLCFQRERSLCQVVSTSDTFKVNSYVCSLALPSRSVNLWREQRMKGAFSPEERGSLRYLASRFLAFNLYFD